MKRICSMLASFASCFLLVSAASARSSSEICAAAKSYVGAIPPNDDAVFSSESLGYWKPLAANPSITRRARSLFMAYFFSDPSSLDNGDSAGAISVKVSILRSGAAQRTKSVELYRPAIPKNENSCHPKGRTAVNGTKVGINKYIQYHSRLGADDDLERFHISYPYGSGLCARTDVPAETAGSFQFDDVDPLPDESLLARIFGTRPALAKNSHEFTKLRSELHFYYQKNSAPGCVGFEVPFDAFSEQATVSINDLSANTFSPRGRWLIQRQ